MDAQMNGITILDGGMGGELVRRGASNRNELWSAQALLDAPDVVAPPSFDSKPTRCRRNWKT